VSDQIMKAAEQLSSMADNVAGFAISSYLLLTFACLKDIGPWVQRQPKPFAIGAGVAGFVYIVAVWCLYFAENHVVGHLPPPLTDVSLWLAFARSLGIAAFAAIGILAVWGAAKGSEAGSARADVNKEDGLVEGPKSAD
jgi:hypothetical protein